MHRISSVAKRVRREICKTRVKAIREGAAVTLTKGEFCGIMRFPDHVVTDQKEKVGLPGLNHRQSACGSHSTKGQ